MKRVFFSVSGRSWRVGGGVRRRERYWEGRFSGGKKRSNRRRLGDGRKRRRWFGEGSVPGGRRRKGDGVRRRDRYW